MSDQTPKLTESPPSLSNRKQLSLQKVPTTIR